MVRDRPADRRASSAWTTSRSCSPAATRWTSTSAPRRWRRTCRPSLGAARRLVQRLLRRPDARDPALRPVHAPLRRVLPAGRHGVQRQERRPRRQRDHRLSTGPVIWGEPGHQRPARLLPAHPPGHEAHPVRLPRAGRDAQPDRRAPRDPARELLRPDRGADEGQDRRRGRAPSSTARSVRRRALETLVPQKVFAGNRPTNSHHVPEADAADARAR